MSRPARAPSPLAVVPAVVLTVVLAGCSSPAGPEAAAFADGFERAAQAVYDADGADRREAPQRGAMVDGCPLVDDAALRALAEAVGVESLAPRGQAFVQGFPEDEVMSCSLVAPDGEGALGLTAGRTRSTAAQVADQQARAEDGAGGPVEVRADGLDPADVVATTRDDQVLAVWIRDDVAVSVGGPLVPDAPTAGEVLATAVAEIARVLTAG